MKKQFAIKIFILLAILSIRTLPNVPAAAQGESAILRPDPLSSGLTPNSQGTVKIVIENVQALYGLEFHLTFDPTVVEVVDADPTKAGIQIEPADWWGKGFVAINQVSNESGQIDFAATLLRPASPVIGNQVVAIINFAASKTGTSALSIASAILSTSDAEEIPFTQQSGGIGVNLGGQAPDLNAIAEPTRLSSNTANTSRLALAGLAMLAFLAALGIFIYALRRK
jgi:hypothetical protein